MLVEIDLDPPEASVDALESDPDKYVDATFSLTEPRRSYGALAIGRAPQGLILVQAAAAPAGATA